MNPSTKRLTTAARFRRSLASASCQSDRPAISSMPAETRGAAISVIADLRVEHAVGEIDQQIERDNQRAIEDHHAHHQRVVAVERALHEIAADAGNAEDGLDHTRSRDAPGEPG